MGKPLDQRRWERLRDAFLELDGPHTVLAARAAGCATGTARKAWMDGTAGRRPIKDIHAEQKARADAMLNPALESHLATAQARLEEAFVTAKEIAQLRSGATAGAQVLASWEHLAGMLDSLATRAAELLRQTASDGDQVGEILDLMAKIVALGERGMRTFSGWQEALRVHLADLGRLESEPGRSKAEARDTVLRAERAVARARRRGLLVEVIDGGDAQPDAG